MEDIKTNSLNKPEEKSNKDKTAKAKFTGEGDILTRATVGDARIYVARTTRLVRKLSLRHNLSHLATAALGRTVTGALLLAATMKNEEGVGIKVTGDGPIQGITGEAQGGIARGYVGKPDVYLPPKNGHLDVGGAVGNGTISVTRYTAGAKPFTGTAELVDGEIADDLTRYLYTSEQTMKRATCRRQGAGSSRRCPTAVRKPWRNWTKMSGTPPMFPVSSIWDSPRSGSFRCWEKIWKWKFWTAIRCILAAAAAGSV